MSLICSICRSEMQAGNKDAIEGLQFSLCGECRRAFEAKKNQHSFGAVLERCSEPVVVLDASGRLLACNRLAEGAVGRPVASLWGLLPGEVLDCSHAKEGDGCGKTEHCGVCALRLALNYTLKNSRGCDHLPGTLACTHKGKPAIRRFTISTQKLGDMVKVTLEDDGYLPVY